MKARTIALIGCSLGLTWPCFAGDLLSREDSLFPVSQDHKWGYIDQKGKTVVEPTYTEAGEFHDGLARVKQDGKWGYIDTHGKLVVAVQFDEAFDFSNGLARVFKRELVGGDFGYIDKTGLARVNLKGKWGWINNDGEYVWNPS